MIAACLLAAASLLIIICTNNIMTMPMALTRRKLHIYFVNVNMAVTHEPSLCPMGVWMTEKDAETLQKQSIPGEYAL